MGEQSLTDVGTASDEMAQSHSTLCPKITSLLASKTPNSTTYCTLHYLNITYNHTHYDTNALYRA